MQFDRSIYQPSAWGQRFHQCSENEAMGGGSAGPGKSLALIWDPLQSQAVVEHVRLSQQIPEGFPPWLAELCKQYPIRAGESEGHALHMRRTMPQLRENIDRSIRMFPKFDPGAVFNKEYHRWTFTSGYKFTFGHCREENSHEDYLSNQYTHIGFDEAWQFTKKQYLELSARLRSADPVLMHLLRIRAVSNPAPGWLKERFVDPHPEGNTTLIEKVPDPMTGEVHKRTRIFLPATLEDNPDKAFVQKYKVELLSKPSHMRARYLYGDWNSMEGGFFEDDWNPGVHVIPPFKIPRDWPKFRSMDWGYRSQGTIGWYALDKEDVLYKFYEFNFRMMKDAEVADRVIEIEKKFGFWDERKKKSRLLTAVADTQLWEERGDSGKSKAATFAEKGVYWQPADKASIARNAERITERLRDHDKDRCPRLLIFEGCRKTREMFASINIDETDSTVPDKKSPLKHWLDETGYAAARASRGAGSIANDLHEFDRADREDDDQEALPRASGFGYGS